MSIRIYTAILFSAIAFLFFVNDSVFSQGNNSAPDNRTNLDILEQEITGELDKIFFYPDINREKQFVFYLTQVSKDKNEKKFMQSVIKKAAGKHKIHISFAKNDSMLSTDSFYYKAKLNIIKMKTTYTKMGKNTFLGEKTMIREVVSDMELEITPNIGQILVKENIETAFNGQIPYDDYERFQTEEYLFTQSTPPNISFLETIIFPAAIVLVSAVATILFFTIRSK